MKQMKKKPSIRFVYRAGKQSQGSTFMRCFQLSAMIRPYLEDRFDIDLLEMPDGNSPFKQVLWARRQAPGTIFVFSKAAINKLFASTVWWLRQRGSLICFDQVDNDHGVTSRLYADIQFCSSYAQLEKLRRHKRQNPRYKGEPMLLLHSYDLRLENFTPRKLDHARMVYFGDPRNAKLEAGIEKTMDVIEISESDEMQAVLPRLAGYNLHYCIRNQDIAAPLSSKPFTKGFTAAACGANVIAHRRTEDVEEFLGSDYPFLVDGDTPDEVLSMIERAKHSYGDADWIRAQSIMQSVKARVSPKALAQQMSTALKEFGIG